jgi:hypothetical protein
MIISIDGGDNTAAAIFSWPNPAVTSIKEPTPAIADALLGWCQDAAAARGETLTLVVEDQYAKIRWAMIGGKMQPTIDLPALLSVARSTEIWVVLAGLRGIPWVRVLASKWQGKMLPGKKALGTKAAAREAFAEIWPTVWRFEGLPTPDKLKEVKATRVNEHIRDASLQGRWFFLFGDQP